MLRLAKIVSPAMALLRQWVRSLTKGDPIRAFADMMMAPTPVALAAAAIKQLVSAPQPGIFQLSGPRDVAYSEVGLYLAHRVGADRALVRPVSASSAGQTPGSTAQHTTLDSSALRERFGITVPHAWEVIDALIETCR
jgi:dTDP-4-dehydrorhamnose reductase